MRRTLASVVGAMVLLALAADVQPDGNYIATHAMTPITHAAATPIPIPISQLFFLAPAVGATGCAARTARGSAASVGGVSGSTPVEVALRGAAACF